MGVRDKFGLFFPDEKVETIFDVNYEKLKRDGKKGIIFDLDNTLSPWNKESLNDEVLELFNRLGEMNFSIGILSNGNGDKIRPFLEELSYPVIFSASKPLLRGFGKILDRMDLNPQETIMIGDQLLTDILGANRLSIYSIQVNPIQPGHEYTLTKLNRYMEKAILKIRKTYRSIFQSEDGASQS